MNYLALLWAGIIAFGIIMYVILDGFDLGLGIMSIFVRDDHHRDLMISSIMPVWDGNETWLVFGGAALYGAFPLAFSTVLPTLYIPIIFMICALLFRGVAFEFRMKATHNSKKIWEWSFFVGSISATFFQGIMLGSFVHGFDFQSGQFILPGYDWLTPFSLFCGFGLMFGYVLLASNWLIVKTVGDLQNLCYKVSRTMLVIVAIFAVIVSIWSPFIDPRIAARWFDPQLMPYLSILPILTAGFFILHWLALNKRKEFQPFRLSVGIFLMCYAGFVVSSWPYIVPRSITFSQAAAPDKSLLFMLVGTVIMLPILLYYTYHSYKIFRGKVTEPIEY